MSFAGHVYDMIRRDKENRELRKSITKGRIDMSKPILGSYRDFRDVSVSELDEVHKSLREKRNRDDYEIAKKKVVLLSIGLIIGFLTLGLICLIEWI